LTQAITLSDPPRFGLLAIAAAGVLTGMVTPLLPPLIDKLSSAPGDFRIALAAVPFALLVAVLVRRSKPDRWWPAIAAAIVTMIAFVCAVNAAIWVDGQATDGSKAIRNILSGLAGGFTGAGVMAVGIHWLAAGLRDAKAWLPMLLTGTLAGALLALDNALDLDLTSVLYPVWQGGVAAGLATALRQRPGSTAV
jgi:hypothetical protein